jgi:hypothetical protein
VVTETLFGGYKGLSYVKVNIDDGVERSKYFRL